jgi:hypothetical protein
VSLGARMRRLASGLSRRVIVAAASLVLAGATVLVHIGLPEAQPLTAARSVVVQARPITAFDPRDPGKRQFGPLTFRGGLELTSADAAFGGLSSIRTTADGGFLAVTDKGAWLRGRIVTRDGRPEGLAEVELAPIRGPDGRPITARRWYDSEALAIDGETAYVAIERVHQILKFDLRRGLAAPGLIVTVPPAVKALRPNKGIEGLVAVGKGAPLAAGTLIALSERGLDGDGNIAGFLIGRQPGQFAIRRSDDYDLTDAALLPDGGLVILERHYSLLRGVAMRLRLLPLAALRPDAVVDGRVLLEADLGYQIDNMEGLSVHRDDAGEIVLTLVSDDNFSLLQRTLLLQFTLTGE